MRHGSEIVDFGRADVGDDGDEVGGIAEVTVVKEEFDTSLVSVFVDVVDTSGIENGCTTDDSVYLRVLDKSGWLDLLSSWPLVTFVCVAKRYR